MFKNKLLKYCETSKVIIMIFLLIMMVDLSAQNNHPSAEGKSLKEIKGLAKNSLRLGDTYSALFYYKEWSERDPRNLKVIFQTAELYRLSRNYKEAEKWYKEIIKSNGEKYPLSYFHLGNAQMALEKYDSAKTNFLLFKKVGRGIKDTKYRKLMKSGIESCDFALNQGGELKSSVVTHLNGDINKAHIEFSPFLLDNETLIFGSLNENSVNYYNLGKHDSLQIPVRKLYIAKKENDQWVNKGEMPGPFNQENVNVGNAVMSEDGKRIYFTLCQKNWQGKMICELYYSDKGKNKWNKAVKMNGLINLPNYTATQAAIGKESKKNQEVIYFVSDRPGGKGGLDIWYTQYNKRRKVFKAPRNAGSKVNSVGTDCTPFYDIETHRLYFSSDGRIGYGGLDVFSINGEKSKWEERQNLGRDINSSADDLDYTLSASKRGGFLVSNRKGGMALLNATCCDDIYEFTFDKYINVNLVGNVIDSVNCLENSILNIYIKEKSGDKYLSKSMKLEGCQFKVPLETGIEYSIEVVKEGYLNSVKEVNTADLSKSMDINVNFNAKKVPKQAMVLEDIFFEYNSEELTDKAKTSLMNSMYKILMENPRIVVEVASHTDNKGSDAYNLNLSNKRAKSVVDFLIKAGIDKGRLQAKGYGESQPIAPNENSDGSDNPTGRELNRRTEMKILGKLSILSERDE